MAIGESLKRFRKEFKLTQANVAKDLGILQQTYYKYENNKATPSADFVIKLADVYGVSADYLLGRSDMPRLPKFDEKTLALLRAMEDKFQPAAAQVPAQ